MIRTRCPCCFGRGTVALTGEYLETYLALCTVGETHGADLARRMGVKPTAMNNRLARLKDKGLVTTRTYGRKVFYLAVEPQ
jgi:Mn-dependent DtxR family transcriptional regulator